MIRSVAFLLSIPLALAQYGGPAPAASSSSSSAPPPSSTDSSSANLQTVAAGQNGFTFSPNSLTAPVGSQVEFTFFGPEHSVVQASFDKPCQPVNDTAFFSGFITTSSGMNVSRFRFTVLNSTKADLFHVIGK